MTQSRTTNSLTPTILWIGLAMILPALGVYLGSLWLAGPEGSRSPESPGLTQSRDPEPNTIASVWQWEEAGAPSGETLTKDEHGNRDREVRFNAEAIYEALQDVRVDDNGNVVLDDRALDALNATFDHGEITLSEQNLELLAELIQIGLPGKAGEQTARVVVDYHHYLEARDEFEAMYDSENTMDPERQYEELQALRSTYLGRDTADQLFAQSDANARYMFNVRKVESDNTLTPEEKTARLHALDEELRNETVPVENWSERYADFQAEKQRILEAGLSPDEKRAQVDALMRRHFRQDERERISYLEIDDL